MSVTDKRWVLRNSGGMSVDSLSSTTALLKPLRTVVHIAVTSVCLINCHPQGNYKSVRSEGIALSDMRFIMRKNSRIF